MKTILYCYAAQGRYSDSHIKHLQRNTISSGTEIGKIDISIALDPDYIDLEFREKYNHILSLPRGVGYWMWKYYFAVKLLEMKDIEEGDILIYADSKTIFKNNIKYFTDIFYRDNVNIMTFCQPYDDENLHNTEKTWTKRDCFVLTGLDQDNYINSLQGWAGFYLYRKNDFSYTFFKEALTYATDYRIITDSPNECGLPNYDTFRDHRHDQSILSLMSKKYNLYPYKYPTLGIEKVNKICIFNNYPNIEIDYKSNYPTMIGYD